MVFTSKDEIFMGYVSFREGKMKKNETTKSHSFKKNLALCCYSWPFYLRIPDTPCAQNPPDIPERSCGFNWESLQLRATLWWTNMATEIPIFNRRYIFTRSIFCCHVSLLEGYFFYPKNPTRTNRPPWLNPHNLLQGNRVTNGDLWTPSKWRNGQHDVTAFFGEADMKAAIWQSSMCLQLRKLLGR